MADEQTAKPPAGRSRGAAINSGGEQEIGAPTPPYEGRQESGAEGNLEKRMGTDPGGAPPREISKEEREGVPVEDTTGASPLGADQSVRGPGNEEMLGASDEELRDARMVEGIDSKQPIDPEMPDVRVGDQGG